MHPTHPLAIALAAATALASATALAQTAAPTAPPPPAIAPAPPAAHGSTYQALPEIRFDGSSLSDCLDFLADATGANISVDWHALEIARVSKDTPITLRLSSNISLRKALQLVLQQAGGTGTLTFYPDQGVIQITTQEQEDKQMITRVYPIQDLLFEAPDYTNAPSLDITNNNSSAGGGGGGGASGSNPLSSAQLSQGNTDRTRTDRAQAIIDLITSSIRPEIWKANGGTASIEFFRDSLIVTAPRSVQDRISSQYRRL